MAIEFTPEDQAPDEDFIEVGRQARLVAHYMLELKDQGLCEYERCEVAKEWIAATFTHQEDQ